MNGTITTTSQFIDDFLRRELRVGNPGDPMEIAGALRKRYSSDAARMDEEAAGFSFSTEPPATVLRDAAYPSATASETQQAQDTLEADFATLISAPANRDRQQELRGWREHLASEWSQGVDAARMATDPG